METLIPTRQVSILLMETLHPNKTGIYIEDGDITSQQDRYLYKRTRSWETLHPNKTGIYIEDGDITSQQDRYLS